MVGERMKLARKLRDMSRAALAVKSGVGFGTIQAIEQGRHDDPRISTLRKIANALDVSVDQLDGTTPLDFDGPTGAYLAPAV